MVTEFREFIMRGNVIDLAVAVVIGAAFGAVITSFVTDILTPLLGLIGVPNFANAAITVGDAQIRYGLFLNALIAFVLIALAIFLFVIKPMNGLEARRQAGRLRPRRQRHVPNAPRRFRTRRDAVPTAPSRRPYESASGQVGASSCRRSAPPSANKSRLRQARSATVAKGAGSPSRTQVSRAMAEITSRPLSPTVR